jgi:hypothetical protein
MVKQAPEYVLHNLYRQGIRFEMEHAHERNYSQTPF